MNWILITFQVEIVALMPCVWLSFTTLRLIEDGVSFAWMRPLGMHLLLVLLNKPNLLKSACIDHNSFACCFPRFLERCDVIVTHYFMKVKCFSFCMLPKLASYSYSICCMLWFCSGGVKSCFHKKWWWRTRRTWYRVKFWWWKIRIGKLYVFKISYQSALYCLCYQLYSNSHFLFSLSIHIPR